VDTLSPHVADAAVEQVLETVAQDGNVSGTSWQVSRAAPEA